MEQKKSDIKFGTDGWRALIAREFTFENVARVIHAYADVLRNAGAQQAAPLHNPIPIGYDRRFLSQDFAQEAATVLAANGFKVLLSQDFCPTPAISWMTKETQAPGGVMITASHNPAPWNGVKFKEGYGGSASPEFTDQVEKKIRPVGDKKSVDFQQAIATKQITYFDPYQQYVSQLQSQIDVAKIRKAGWKIAYDSLFGAGSGYLTKVLETPLHEIHHEENPAFGGLNPEPIAQNLQPLIQHIRDNHLDVGLATDGDADRIGAVDEAGNFVTPQQIFSLLLRHLIDKGGKGDVIKTVSTTQMIDRIAKKFGLPVHETPVGFKHICGKFLTTTPLIGGEESGGIGIPSHVYERDGLLSGLLLLEMMTERKKRLKALLEDLEKEIGHFVFLREDLHLAPQSIARVRELLTQKDGPAHGQNQIGPLKLTRVNQMDGCKYYFADGSWLLFRASGTEPLVRIYAEASDPAVVKKLLVEARELLGV